MRTFTLYGINYTWWFSKTGVGGILRTPNAVGMVLTKPQLDGSDEYIATVHTHYPAAESMRMKTYIASLAVDYVEKFISDLTEEDILWGAP